jgi:hypothetical protein
VTWLALTLGVFAVAGWAVALVYAHRWRRHRCRIDVMDPTGQARLARVTVAPGRPVRASDITDTRTFHQDPEAQ